MGRYVKRENNRQFKEITGNNGLRPETIDTGKDERGVL